MLLDRGANIHARNTCGSTVLHDAIQRGKMEIHNPTSKRGCTSLHSAAENKQEEVAELLVNYMELMLMLKVKAKKLQYFMLLKTSMQKSPSCF